MGTFATVHFCFGDILRPIKKGSSMRFVPLPLLLTLLCSFSPAFAQSYCGTSSYWSSPSYCGTPNTCYSHQTVYQSCCPQPSHCQAPMVCCAPTTVCYPVLETTSTVCVVCPLFAYAIYPNFSKYYSGYCNDGDGDGDVDFTTYNSFDYDSNWCGGGYCTTYCNNCTNCVATPTCVDPNVARKKYKDDPLPVEVYNQDPGAFALKKYDRVDAKSYGIKIASSEIT